MNAKITARDTAGTGTLIGVLHRRADVMAVLTTGQVHPGTVKITINRGSTTRQPEALAGELCRRCDAGTASPVKVGFMSNDADTPHVGTCESTNPVVGYAPGVFDLFHIGHLNLLRAARDHCDVLIAGVVTDELAAVRKGAEPTIPFAERLEIVSSINVVDRAEPEDGSKVAMWERLRFDVVIKGDDWADTARGRDLEASFRPLGVQIAYVPYTPTTSSTHLRSVLDVVADGAA